MSWLTRWQTKSGNPAVRARAAAALGASRRPSAVEPLIALAADPDPAVRRSAVEALGRLGDARAVDALARQLQGAAGPRDEAAVSVRVAAAHALGQIGAAALPALAAVLHDRNQRVREAAVDALGAIGGPSAVPALAAALGDDRSQLRQAAAKALAAIGGDDARTALLPALCHKDPATRVTAVQALGRLGDTRSVGALASALSDREKAVREGAIAALGQLGSSDAAEALLAAYEGADRDVRHAAAEVLRALAWSAATPRQRAFRAVIGGDFAAAVAEGHVAVEPLLIALEDRDGRARRLAADSLGTIGDPRAAGPLVDVLADHDDQVRTAAGQALVRIGPAAAPAVIEGLGAKSGPLRAAASAILASIGEGQAMAPLLSVLTPTRAGHTGAARPAIVRHGQEMALLHDEEDLVQIRRTVETLRALLAHAAGRVPLPMLELAAGLTDLIEAVHRDARAAGYAPSPPEEVSCAEVRELARQELGRRRGSVSPSSG